MFLIVVFNVIVSLILLFYRKPTLSSLNPAIGTISFFAVSVILVIEALIIGQNSINFDIFLFLGAIFLITSVILFIVYKIKGTKDIDLYEKWLNLGGCILIAGIIIAVLIVTMPATDSATWKVLLWPEICIVIGQLIILLNKAK